MNKNFYRLKLFFTCLNLFYCLTAQNTASPFHQTLQNAGKTRVFEVMYKGPGGIEKVNKEIVFAETKNLAFDLNLAEISKKFDCKTMMGQAFINFMLTKVISPKDMSHTIEHRQKLIKVLVENPDLQLKIEELVTQAVEHEATLMEFMQNRFVMDPHGDPIRFVLQLMRSNIVWQAYEQGTSLLSMFETPTQMKQKWFELISLAPSYADTFTLMGSGAASAKLVDHWFKYEDAKKISFSKVGLGLLTAVAVGTLAKTYLQYTDFSLKLTDLGIASKGAIFGAYGLYTHYTEAFGIRKSLYALNQLISIAEQIEQLCQQYNIEHQFKVSDIQSEKGKELLTGLKHTRYKEKDSYLFFTIPVHTFVYDVYKHDINFSPLYDSIAEMDAYLAIARKMSALQNSDSKFCYAEFIDDQKPFIHAKDFWNILVNKGNVVTNNLFESRNIILTGSNEGGKTTAIRAILQNIVLAQTFGIAAASEFNFTPFDVIHSYLNISDDILHGRSRYAAELKQAQDILGRIKSLQNDEKLFFTLDELFTGTNGEDGAAVAYNFINNIASLPKIQFIYATHFDRLKQIGEKNLQCANYKIEAPYRDAKGNFIRDEDGQLIYPYKFSPGANDVNVALERAKDAGIFVAA